MNIATPGSIEIDKVEMLDAVPTTLKLDYNFSTDDDAENWEPLGDAIVAVFSDALLFTFGGEAQPKLSQQAHHVNADENQYVNITIENTSSTDDQMRFSYPDPVNGGRVFRTVEIPTEMDDFQTFQFDLASEAWTGEVSDFQVAFRNAASGMSDGQGTVIIDRIQFNNVEILGVSQNNLAEVSLYPNPSNSVVTINTLETIENVSVYSQTGRLVYDAATASNTVDVSNLAEGVYFVSVKTNKGTGLEKLVVSKR